MGSVGDPEKAIILKTDLSPEDDIIRMNIDPFEMKTMILPVSLNPDRFARAGLREIINRYYFRIMSHMKINGDEISHPVDISCMMVMLRWESSLWVRTTVADVQRHHG